MPRKLTPRPKNDDPAEYKRFIETAKQVEADEDPKAFERAFKKITSQQPRKSQ